MPLQSLFAQISFGGTPPSWNQPKSKLKTAKELKTNLIENPFTIEQLIEDEKRSEILSERVGINLATRLSVTEDGEWDVLASGEKICRLKIVSPSAVAISVYYSKFKIPQGAKLYIYNGDYSHLLGAYTSQTNPYGEEFATEFVAGDNLIFEYVASAQDDTPQIEIEKICYGYKNLKVVENDKLACMVDVNCSEGENWQEEKDGVVKMVTTIGNYTFLCSATLLNNTAEDFIPYIYTAFHCLEDDGAIASAIDLKQTIFYFNYETSECGNDQIKETTALVGCTLLEGKSLDSAEGLDQALLLMNSSFPNSLVPYFNGWNVGTTPPQKGVSIHHPKGSVKKISTYITPAVSKTWPSINSSGGINAHWVVEFTRTANGYSVTEGGSSGSPLFNQERLVTGALTGGSSSCAIPNGLNYYGKIERFWKYISKYLDPLNSGVSSFTGKRKGEIIPSPKSLNAEWIENASKAKLTWMGTDNTPSNYVVYRNGVIVGRPITNSFVDEDLYTGKHVYEVSAYYKDKKYESPKSNQTVLIKQPTVTPNIDSIERISENNIVLNWSIPQSEQKIFWGSEKPFWGISTTNSLPLYFGQMWSSSDLEGLDGYLIKRVATSCLANINYTLYIKQGSNIYTQNIPVSSTDEDVEIVLDKEFVIDSKNPLYCSLRVNSGNGSLVKVDGEDIVEGKGNLVSLDGYEWRSIDTKGNISIKAIISPPLTRFNGTEDVSNFSTNVVSSSLPCQFKEPKEFLLYCNQELVATFSGNTFKWTEINLPRGKKYEYRIEARYTEGEVRSSNPYTFYLSEKSFISQIENIVVNGVELSIDKDNQCHYPASCSNDYAEICVTAKNNGEVIIDNTHQYSYTKDISSGGKYNVPITIISESGESRTEYNLNLYKLPDNLLLKRWSDVLSINNNPENNGALNFVEFEWYMNGEKLPSTEQYITLPKGSNSNDIFSIKVLTKEGIELESCEISFDDEVCDMLLYPIVVNKGDDIFINISAPQSSNIVSTLTHVSGQMQTLYLALGENVIKAPQTPGIYIVNTRFPNGETKSIKFMVK